MRISQQFRMSQVEGYGGTTSGNRAEILEPRQSIAWVLPEDAETRRAAILGPSNKVDLPLSVGIPCASSIHHLQGHFECLGMRQRLSRLGRVSRALHEFVSESESTGKVETKSNRKRHLARNNVVCFVDTFFHLAAKETEFDTLVWRPETKTVSKPQDKNGYKSSCRKQVARLLGNKAEHSRKRVVEVPRSLENAGRKDACDVSNEQPAPSTHSFSESSKQKTLAPADPRNRNACAHDPSFGKHRSEPKQVAVPSLTKQRHRQRIPTQCIGQKLATDFSGNIEQYPEEAKDLRMQTPGSSSDEENSDEDQHTSTVPDVGTELVQREMPTTPGDTIFLSIQDSSSDEEDETKPGASVGNASAAVSLNKSVAKITDGSEQGEKPKSVPSASMKIQTIKQRAMSKSLKAQKRRVFDDTPEFENPSLNSLCRSLVEGSIQEENDFSHHSKEAGKMRLYREGTTQSDQSKKLLSIGSKSAFSASDQLVDSEDSSNGDEGMDDDIDILCGICASGDSPSEDPIVLCDGPGGSAQCEVAVHASCYSVSRESLKQEYWRCDACQYRFTGGTVSPRCFICNEKSGPLSIFLGIEWIHKNCKASAEKSEPQNEPIGTSDVESMPDQDLRRRKRKVAREIRKKRYENFFDEEAAIASGEDADGDEADERLARDIEDEEELHKDFINDSSQLGYTQDEIDRVDVNQNDEHRALDAGRALQDAFATPTLNRQMLQARSDASSLPSSLRGLGQMHFIRSVIEHHRQGGSADEIEQAYHDLKAQETPVDEEHQRRSLLKRKRRVFIDDSESD